MKKPVCILQSPIWTRSGYGDWALTIAKSLLRYNKFDLKLAPTPWGACSQRNLDEQADPEIKELLGMVLRQNLHRQPELFIQMTIPNEFATPAKFNIGMTAGIETTVPKPEWIEGLNRMQYNIVTSQFTKDIFVGANYTKRNPDGTTESLLLKKPMDVLFWGADTKIYGKNGIESPEVNNIIEKFPEDFYFLFVGQWTAGNINSDRKAIGWLIKTFLETFSNMDNAPALILKTNGAQISIIDKYDCINKINDVINMVKSQRPNIKLPNVYLIHGELTDIEMNALYNHKKIKAHISFTHGEGFGHPLLLASLSGKPVITPKWSGHLDFLNAQYADFFPGKLSPIPNEAINDWFIKEAQWFDVNYEEAGKILKNIYNHYDEKLLNKYENLRIENMEKFSIQAMDKAFHSLLDKNVPKFAIEEEIKLPKLRRITLPKSNSSTTPPSEITSSMSAETPNLQASSGQGSVEIPTKDAELKEANKLETEISK
ncbi:MAG TPA: hypothetical protein PLC59_00115 [Bacteroidales bacterium]|jgi:hypothetical protein|nr:hypothetical protein [Bacteroidales bacterium]HQI44467.1 hypothetical protein [Bacteroidales bacterium]